jgi:hypothetical protein
MVNVVLDWIGNKNGISKAVIVILNYDKLMIVMKIIILLVEQHIPLLVRDVFLSFFEHCSTPYPHAETSKHHPIEYTHLK